MLGRPLRHWEVDQLLFCNYKNNKTFFSKIDGFCVAYVMMCLLWQNNSGLQTLQQYVVGNFTQKIWSRSVRMLARRVGCGEVDQLLFRNYKNNTTLISIIDGFCVANAMICSLWKPIERNAVCQKCVVTNFTQKSWRRSASIPERSLSPEKVGQLLFCNYKNYKTFFQ